jgi:hypothetical protein
LSPITAFEQHEKIEKRKRKTLLGPLKFFKKLKKKDPCSLPVIKKRKNREKLVS